MATKNDPGPFDCYANAKPDEPMFVLLGRDPSGYLLVLLWAQLREDIMMSPERDPLKNWAKEAEQINEARMCARLMQEYAKSLGKDTTYISRKWNNLLRNLFESRSR